MQANLPGSRKLAGERAMRNAILCGSGFERASEATSNFRIKRMPEDMDEVYDGLSTQSAEELRMTPWPGRTRWSRPGRTSQP